MNDLTPLQEKLGHVFRDPDLLRTALTHPSVAHEANAPRHHNQRLEFLGDAVLGQILASELYEKFPDASEGDLTNARAHLVNRRALAEQARSLGLGEHLIMSRSERNHQGHARGSALADAFEAVVGAILLDAGHEATRAFVLRRFRETLGELSVLPNLHNPKGELQELLQARSPEAPVYEVVHSSGPDHDRMFESVVRHQGIELGRGAGKSKQAAESHAAVAALEQLKQTPL